MFLFSFYHSSGSKNLKFLGVSYFCLFFLKTFQGRLRKIMDSSQNCFNEDTSKLVEKLDESERILFKEGQQALNDFQCWETRKTEKLKTSEMVKNHRKRKRVVLEET